MNKKRIEEMQEKMLKIQQVQEKLNNILEELDYTQGDILDFSSYYGSQEWFDDKEAIENEFNKTGKYPFVCNVLSEDEPYEVICNIKETSLKLLDYARSLLENY